MLLTVNPRNFPYSLQCPGQATSLCYSLYFAFPTRLPSAENMSTFTAINDLNEEDELFPPINPNGALKMSPESTDMEDSSAVQVKQEEQSQAVRYC